MGTIICNRRPLPRDREQLSFEIGLGRMNPENGQIILYFDWGYFGFRIFYFCKSLTLQELLDKQLTHWEIFCMQGQNYFSQSSIYDLPLLKSWIYLSLDFFYHVKLLSVIHPCVCAHVFSVKLQCREH